MTEIGLVLRIAIVCLLICSVCSPGEATPGPDASLPSVQSLDGDWRLRAEDKEIDWRTRYWEKLLEPKCLDAGYDDSGWLAAKVPGYVQFDCGLKDRWWGYDLFRVNFKPWIYRRTFTVPSEFRGRRVELAFGAVQYWTVVWLNGKKLGTHEGFFDPFSFDATDALNYDGENVLVVAVTNPWSWRQEGVDDKITIQGLLENWDAKSFDLLPIGISRSVRLIAHEGLIDRAQVDVSLKADHSSAKVSLKAWMLSKGKADRVRFEILPKGFKPRSPLPKPIEVALSKSGEASASAVIAKPELWWTWDQGKPNLYTLRVTALAGSKPLHVREEVFGVRSVRLDITMTSGAYYLNGRKVFLRGVNVIPDQYPGLVDAARLQRLIGQAKEANMNFLRLHAQVMPEFYKECDEEGVLVWSDFPLMWGYTYSHEFVDRAVAQYHRYIAMCRNHPSIGIWCVHNEPAGIYYRELCPTLYELTKKLDPSRPVIQGSGIDRDPLRSGDGHAYAGGPQDPLGHLRFHSYVDRFNTEYGFGQVPPSIETIKKYYPADEQIIRRFYVTSMAGLEDMEFVVGGKTTTAGADAISLEEYIARMWESQAVILKYQAETQRLQKGTMAGMTQHSLNDSWPFNNYGVVDYDGIKKQPGFDALAEGNRPLHVMLEYTRRPLAIWVVNDLPQSFKGATVTWSVKPDRSNTLKWKPVSGRGQVGIEANSLTKVADLRKAWGDVEGPTVVRLELRSSSGRVLDTNAYHFDFAKPHVKDGTRVLFVGRPSSQSKQSAAIVEGLVGMGAKVTECGEEVAGRAVFPAGDLRSQFDAAILMETVEAGTILREPDAAALVDAVKNGMRLIHISGADDDAALGEWFAQVATPARIREHYALTELLPVDIGGNYYFDQLCSRRTVEPAFDDHPVTEGLDFSESFHRALNLMGVREGSLAIVRRGSQPIVLVRKSGDAQVASILLIPYGEEYNFQELLARLISLDYPTERKTAAVEAPMPALGPDNGLAVTVSGIDPERTSMWTATPAGVALTGAVQRLEMPQPKLTNDLTGQRRHFAAEFTGFIYAPLDGEYQLGLRAENGAWMWIDDEPAVAAPMVKGWDAGGIPTLQGTVRLEKGFHRIKMLYLGYERLDMRHNLFLETKWQLPGFPEMDDIPANYFFKAQPESVKFGKPYKTEITSWQ